LNIAKEPTMTTKTRTKSCAHPLSPILSVVLKNLMILSMMQMSKTRRKNMKTPSDSYFFATSTRLIIVILSPSAA
jgi:hypothetical protein